MNRKTKRTLISLLIPPLAVCWYGCSRCCAAPIGVFWLTGMGGIVYGLLGGPAGLPTISWTTVLLGIGLWGLAFIWAATVMQNTDDPKCTKKPSPLCKVVGGNDHDDANPLEDVKKYY